MKGAGSLSWWDWRFIGLGTRRAGSRGHGGYQGVAVTSSEEKLA